MFGKPLGRGKRKRAALNEGEAKEKKGPNQKEEIIEDGGADALEHDKLLYGIAQVQRSNQVYIIFKNKSQLCNLVQVQIFELLINILLDDLPKL